MHNNLLLITLAPLPATYIYNLINTSLRSINRLNKKKYQKSKFSYSFLSLCILPDRSCLDRFVNFNKRSYGLETFVTLNQIVEEDLTNQKMMTKTTTRVAGVGGLLESTKYTLRPFGESKIANFCHKNLSLQSAGLRVCLCLF